LESWLAEHALDWERELGDEGAATLEEELMDALPRGWSHDSFAGLTEEGAFSWKIHESCSPEGREKLRSYLRASVGASRSR